MSIKYNYVLETRHLSDGTEWYELTSSPVSAGTAIGNYKKSWRGKSRSIDDAKHDGWEFRVVKYKLVETVESITTI